MADASKENERQLIMLNVSLQDRTIDPRKFAPNCFVSIKLEIVLQNNYLPILRPEELVCANLSTQAKNYSGLKHDRGNYFVAVKEMNRSLTPINCSSLLNLGLQLQNQYHP